MSAVVPSLFAGLCDDAAIFPPGNLTLEQAVPAHLRHRGGVHSPLVGTFVVAESNLADLATLTAGMGPGTLDLAVTAPLPRVADVSAAVSRNAALRLTALEVALPDDIQAADVMARLQAAVGAHTGVTVCVEVHATGVATRSCRRWPEPVTWPSSGPAG